MWAFLSVVAICASALFALQMVIRSKAHTVSHAPISELQSRLSALEDRFTASSMSRR